MKVEGYRCAYVNTKTGATFKGARYKTPEQALAAGTQYTMDFPVWKVTGLYKVTGQLTNKYTETSNTLIREIQ